MSQVGRPPFNQFSTLLTSTLVSRGSKKNVCGYFQVARTGGSRRVTHNIIRYEREPKLHIYPLHLSYASAFCVQLCHEKMARLDIVVVLATVTLEHLAGSPSTGASMCSSSSPNVPSGSHTCFGIHHSFLVLAEEHMMARLLSFRPSHRSPVDQILSTLETSRTNPSFRLDSVTFHPCSSPSGSSFCNTTVGRAPDSGHRQGADTWFCPKSIQHASDCGEYPVGNSRSSI